MQFKFEQLPDNMLKPCPLCECTHFYKWYDHDVDDFPYSIVCRNGDCQTEGYATAEEAIAAWNTRPIEDALRAEIFLLKKQRDLLAKVASSVDCSWCPCNCENKKAAHFPDGKIIKTDCSCVLLQWSENKAREAENG